jgi:amino acid adenylation domain-containing protein
MMKESLIEGFRLSRQQKRMWQRQQQDQSPAYRAQCAVLVEGSLDRHLFKAAIAGVFERHEILRTIFQYVPEMNMPLQVIKGDLTAQIDEYDFTSLGPQRQEGEIEKLFQRMGQSPMDLESGPTSQLALVTLTPCKHVLVISLPAMRADAKTLANIVDESQRAYVARLMGEDLTDEVCQYIQYSEWQNELLSETNCDEALEFWDKQLLAADTVLCLPCEISSPTEATFEPRVCTTVIEAETTAKIDSAAAAYGVSGATLLLACWEVLLWRLTGQSEIVVGHLCERGDFEELQGVLGPFAEALPICARLCGSTRFSNLLEQTEEALRKAAEWQDYFTWDQKQQSERAGARPPFISFCFESGQPLVTQATAGVSFATFKRYACTDRFKIRLSCSRQADSLTLELHYDRNLFRAPDIQHLALQLQTLIESAADATTAAINDLEILSDIECRKILVDFNDTRKKYSPAKSVLHLFERQAEQMPDAVALICEEEHLTYRELNERANQLARHLRSQGVGPEVRVGLCLERCPEMIIGILGVLKSGGAYVPFEPTLPKKRLESFLEDAQVAIMLTQKSLLNSLAGHRVTLLCLDADWESISTRQSQANVASGASADNAVYVIYTSGSTGQPKGVVVEHRQLLAYVQSIVDRLELPAGADFAIVSSFAADLGNTATFSALCTGGCLHIISQARASDPHLLSEYFTRHPVDCLKIVPSHLAMLLRASAGREVLPRQRLILGGEAAHWKLIDEIRELAPQCSIYNHYGPTETTVGAVCGRVEANQPRVPNGVPLGRPIANAQVFILKDNFQPALIGEAGELCIGGDGVSRGYLNGPAPTAEKFIPNPYGTDVGQRLYRTADRARFWADGSIEFLGRLDRQVKIRGFRVEPAEIESALLLHPEIGEAVVVAHENEQSDKRLVAYVVGNQGQRFVNSELQSFLQASLTDYMVPSAFVQLQELPHTANGKIDYRALPQPDYAMAEQEYAAPRTAVEEMLSNAWAEVLGRECVGVNDNFFDLGGHSLLVILLVSRVRDVFGVEIPLASVFQQPTVGELARSVEAALQGGEKPTAPPLQRVSREQILPLSYAQQRLWFIDQMEPGSVVYNMPMARRLRGAVNVSALERALSEMIRRHESLRTTFKIIDGDPSQVITAAHPFHLPIVDLSHLPEPLQEMEAQRLVNEEAQRPFDISAGPLFHAQLLKLGEAKYVMFLMWHHIISDGWSTEIFFEELSALYNAYARVQASPLKELDVQYADYAIWQREWSRGDALANQVSYWKQQLGDAPVIMDLPADRQRPATQSYKGAVEAFTLSATLTRQMKELSKREGVTLFMMMLAAFQVLLWRYSGQEDVVVGTPSAGRGRSEIEGLIGFFVNTLALRVNLSGALTFNDVLSRVKETCLGAYTHQDVPFDKLVEELRPERSLSHQPLFQVLFQLQNGSRQTLSLDGIAINTMNLRAQTTKYDLMLTMLDTEPALHGALQYSTDLFDASTVERMARHYEHLLASLVADPCRRVSELFLLSESERRQQLVEWNDTAREFPSEQCIHHLFDEQVARTPDAVAVVCGAERLSYCELNERANRLAHYLQEQGVGPESLVGIMLERSTQMVVSLLGVLKAGGAYLPLDTAYPPERLRQMLDDSGAQVFLTQTDLATLLPQTKCRLIFPDLEEELIEKQSSEAVPSEVTAENLAYVNYTSGSTGRPKGILIQHRSVLRLLCNTDYVQLCPADIVAQVSNCSFDAATFEVWGALLAGATLDIISTEVLLAPAQLAAQLRAHGITTMFLTAALFNQVAHEIPEAFNAMRQLLVGGEALDVRSVVEVLKAGGPQRLLNGYGPTEGTTFTTWQLVDEVSPQAQTIPIGRPIANTRVYVLDKELQPVPVGVRGELYIGGDGLARGYLHNPELTAESFVPDPFAGQRGERLYRTGDVVRYLSDGRIEFLGRSDNQVKIRGFRIELGEIEGALSAEDGVREAVVHAHEHEGEKRLVGYVVGDEGEEVDTHRLRSRLKERLPEYMVPAAIVVLEQMPLTANGKIDRGALTEPVGLESSREEYVGPRNMLEEKLCGVWAEVLKVERVGVFDNFFELGGYSLLATKLIARVRDLFMIEVPLQSVFALKTVAELAELVEKCISSGDASVSVPIRRLERELHRAEVYLRQDR